jgi:hypothetical protein
MSLTPVTVDQCEVLSALRDPPGPLEDESRRAVAERCTWAFQAHRRQIEAMLRKAVAQGASPGDHAAFLLRTGSPTALDLLQTIHASVPQVPLPDPLPAFVVGVIDTETVARALDSLGGAKPAQHLRAGAEGEWSVVVLVDSAPMVARLVLLPKERA